MVMPSETTRMVKGYQIQERIGQGGFGAVYRAFQPVIEREVAIKVILPEYANQSDFIRNFELEARLVARLEHPHIVPLFDFWRDPQGAFIVMRMIRGGSLRNLLDQADGPLAPEAVVNIISQVTSALHIAHRNNVVHRDIKPENILLDEDGNAYLTDFGIALKTDADIDKFDEDVISGSLGYMSPDQLQSRAPNPTFDVYSLGIMLYEMLTGHYPYPHDNQMQLVMKHLNDEVPSVLDIMPDYPHSIDDIVQRATAKAADERYDDIRDMARELQAVLLNGGSDPAAIDWDAEFIENPYKGLSPFDESDSNDFYGRETLIEALVERLQQSNFLAVVGPSGSGKSSVVNAGLVPALRRGAIPGAQDWFSASFVPGSKPFEALEAALLSITPMNMSLLERLKTDPDGLIWAAKRILIDREDHLLLVIDQFEEVFTLVEDEAQRLQFLSLLTNVINAPDVPIHVVVTLRADFYDRPLYYEAFGSLVQKNTQVVLPMTPSEIELAITGPAQRVGLQVDSNFVAALVGDVQKEPGALPLLQYTLTEAFEHRDKNVLTLDAYHAVGGVQGALARRADEVFKQFTDRQKQATRQIFLRLVTLGEGTEDTRRRASRKELLEIVSDVDAANTVFDTFGRYRLLLFDSDPSTRAPLVEVAHEALIRNWRQLRDWLDESRDDIRLQHALAAAAHDWQESGKDRSYLLRGSRLRQFESWVEETSVRLLEAETQFLHASTQERRRQETRQRRARQAVILSSLVVSIILLALTGFAFNRGVVATNARATSDVNVTAAVAAEATAGRTADEAQSLLWANGAQQALQRDDVLLARALALQANEIDNPALFTQRVLAEASYSPGFQRRLEGHADTVADVKYSPDGSLIASSSFDHSIILWDTQTGEPISSLVGHDGPVVSIAFSPDGTRLASGSFDRSVIIWDVSSGEVLQRMRGHEESVRAVDYDPDGTQVISASFDQTLMLWDVETGERVRTFVDGHSDTIWNVVFSPDGRWVVSTGRDNMLVLWDVASGQVLRVLEGHQSVVLSAVFSKDGRTLVSSGGDRRIIRWDLATGSIMGNFSQQGGWLWDVALNPTDTTAIAASEEGRLTLWNLDTGALVFGFEGHTGVVRAVAFSPSGRTVVSSGEDNTLIIWDVVSGAVERIYTVVNTTPTRGLALHPDGDTFLSGSAEGNLYLWDMNASDPIAVYSGGTIEMNQVAISPDGKLALSTSVGGMVEVWDLEAGQMIRQLNGHTDDGTHVTFARDGMSAFSTGYDGQIIRWDIATGRILQKYEGHSDRVWNLALSEDGSRAVSASSDGTAILWDVETGDVLQKYQGHSDTVFYVAFSPDEQMIATASRDRTLMLWDTGTGASLLTLTGHADWVWRAQFSADGTRLLSSSEDRTIRLWDLEEGRLLRTYAGHYDHVDEVLFIEEDTAFLSASRDKTMMLWRFDVQENLMEWTRQNRAVRDFTCLEREEFLIEPYCDDATPAP